jgi:hypothetical protein
MKAEHRKELHTNVLADRVGRFLQRAKQKPRRRSVLIVLLVVGVLVGGFIWYRISQQKKRTDSELWVAMEGGRPADMKVLLSERYLETGPGKAALFQVAWIKLWEEGIKELGARPISALYSQSKDKPGAIPWAFEVFDKLAKDCKDDPVLGPQALYGKAVATEAYAVLDLDKLKDALTKYKDVAKQFPDSAHGKMAKARAEYLEKNMAQVRAFYDSFQRDIGADELRKQQDEQRKLQELLKKIKSGELK